MDAELQNVVGIVTAVSAAVAAIFSAWSAWIAQKSAKAAQDSVAEARAARKATLSPRLVLEKDFLDFHFEWPHPNSLNGEAVFLARNDWKDTAPSPPTFSLTNHGESPALEISVVFEFDDPNGELSVPPEFAPLGLSIMHLPSVSDAVAVAALQYSLPNGRGAGLPLYRKWTTDLPNCAPHQTRKLEFPQSMLNLLLLRGLQAWTRRGSEDALKPITMTVTIRCHTIEAEEYRTQFRYEANPFWQGQSSPLVVVGHFWELPMFEKHKESRVA